MINRKSLVLSDVDEKSNKKAVLSIQNENGEVKGTLRLYNFLQESGLLSLGFYVGGKVIKSGLTKIANMLYSFFIDEDILSKEFSCAVVEVKNGEATPILYGSSEGRQEDIYANIISEISRDKSVENVKEVLDKYDVDFEDDVKENIEEEIDKCISKDCENCPYKKFFYEKGNIEIEEPKIDEKEVVVEQGIVNENLDTNLEEKQDEKIEEREEVYSFVSELKPQIDKLFEKNPIEDNLQSIFPNSKFVKIEYEDEGDFYVFGLIYEGDNIKYVCYGVPAVYEEQPPKELSGFPVFVPLDKEKQNGFGYWLTYQDAETGEPVKAVID